MRANILHPDFASTSTMSPTITRRVATLPARPAGPPMLQRSLGNLGSGEVIQAKLRVGPASDSFEKEADRVADQVVAMRAPTPASTGVVQRCAACEEDDRIQRCSCEEERVQRCACEGEDRIQRCACQDSSNDARRRPAPDDDEELLNPSRQSGSNVPAGRVPHHVERQVNAARRHGSPLPMPVRTYFETRMGRDFGRVRIHHGTEATRATGAVHARAFTIGADVVFGAGQYDPSSTHGRHLLAHELTHVVQQGRAPHTQSGARSSPQRAANPTASVPQSAGPSRRPVPARAGRGACCASALSGGLDGGDYGGVVCCNNVKHSCVWYRNVNRRVRNAAARTIVGACVRTHENTHLNDIDCTGAAVERPGFRADRVPDDEECTAYRAEVACYNRRIRDCGDAACRRDVRRERRFARRQIRNLC